MHIILASSCASRWTHHFSYWTLFHLISIEWNSSPFDLKCKWPKKYGLSYKLIQNVLLTHHFSEPSICACHWRERTTLSPFLFFFSSPLSLLKHCWWWIACVIRSWICLLHLFFSLSLSLSLTVGSHVLSCVKRIFPLTGHYPAYRYIHSFTHPTIQLQLDSILPPASAVACLPASPVSTTKTLASLCNVFLSSFLTSLEIHSLHPLSLAFIFFFPSCHSKQRMACDLWIIGEGRDWRGWKRKSPSQWGCS